MENLYEQIGNYLVTCIDDKETLELMVKELMPLLKQVNYIALEASDLKETHDRLGLGDQAITILSNVVAIYKVNTGKPSTTLLSACGLDPNTISEVESNQNYVWVPAGILLLGSGVIANLRNLINDNSKRSDIDRT